MPGARFSPRSPVAPSPAPPFPRSRPARLVLRPVSQDDPSRPTRGVCAVTKLARSDAERDLVETARRVLPAGGFGNMPSDIVISEGRAGRVTDVSGTEYGDYLLGCGRTQIGHRSGRERGRRTVLFWGVAESLQKQR